MFQVASVYYKRYLSIHSLHSKHSVVNYVTLAQDTRVTIYLYNNSTFRLIFHRVQMIINNAYLVYYYIYFFRVFIFCLVFNFSIIILLNIRERSFVSDV